VSARTKPCVRTFVALPSDAAAKTHIPRIPRASPSAALAAFASVSSHLLSVGSKYIKSPKAIVVYTESTTADVFARIIIINSSTWVISFGTEVEIYDATTVNAKGLCVKVVDTTGLHAVVQMIAEAGATSGRVFQALTLDVSANTVTADTVTK